MEINRLLVNEEERQILSNLAQSFDNKIHFVQESEGVFLLLIDDKDAEVLAEKVQDKLVLEGFDYFYNLTASGKIYERLVEKFGEIGW